MRRTQVHKNATLKLPKTLAFEERMTGTYLIPGSSPLIEGETLLTLRAEGPISELRKNRTIRAFGRFSANGLIDSVRAQGVLTIDLFGKYGHPKIEYDLSLFEEALGERHRLFGAKRLKWDPFRFVRSITNFDFTITAESGAFVATGKMHFSILDDLIPFLLSGRLS